MATGGCLDLALQYMIAGKLFPFMGVTDRYPEYAAELPWLIDRICEMFTPGELADYLRRLKKPMSYRPRDRERYNRARELLLHRNFRLNP
jgi:hypothetical protein